MIVTYLGPAGTSDFRAIDLLSTVRDPEPLPMTSVNEIIQTVNYMPGCLGIVPLEDSIDGELTIILDKLIFSASSILIREEVVLTEEIRAFSRDGRSAITTAVSHPMILELCSQFVRERGLAAVHTTSTAEACRIVAQASDAGFVALAPPQVGFRAGLSVSADQVMDMPDIRTRYALIGREVAMPTGDDKTSIVVTPSSDRVGFLADISACFAKHGINMTSILSRPLQAKLGNYSFHITCSGHITDVAVQAVIDELVEVGASVKLLGSYPRWEGIEVTSPSPSLPLGSVDKSSSLQERAKLLNPPLVQGLRRSPIH